MKCFLHIGTAKTATTTIQKFLDINRQELLRKGYIYTKSAGKANNRKLPVTAYCLNRRDDCTKQYGIDSNDKLLSLQKKIVNDLKTEIVRLSKNDSEFKVIFSSEHIQSRLTNIEEIKRLKEILYSLGLDDVSVIVYLRNPVELANSIYSTKIKAGSLAERPSSPSSPEFCNICNHRNTLKKFGSIFGESALIPRIFGKNEFKNGLITDDFLDAIGAPIHSSYSIPSNSNESLSVTGINILRHLNEKIPRFIDNKPNPIRADLVSYIGKHFSDSKYIMPSYLCEQYDLEFRDSNEWVRKKYFPHKQNLFEVSSYPEETKLKIPSAELDNIAKLIEDIWIDKQEQIINLKRNTSHTNKFYLGLHHILKKLRGDGV